MRTISTFVLTLLLASGLMGCVGGKVGVVNPARLFQDSDSGKAGIEHLKLMETAMQEQLVTAQGVIEKSPGDEALRARFQQVFMGYQQVVGAEQQKVVEGINEQIQATLEAYRKQKGMTVILNGESVLTYAPEADVTDAIITEMNGKPLSFAPVKLEPLDVQPTPKAAPKSKK